MSRPALLSSTINTKIAALARVQVPGKGAGRPADFVKLADVLAIVKAHIK